MGGDQALLRIIRALCATALRRAQRLAFAIDGLDACQPRSVQRQTQSRCSKCRRAALRRGAEKKDLGGREVERHGTARGSPRVISATVPSPLAEEVGETRALPRQRWPR